MPPIDGRFWARPHPKETISDYQPKDAPNTGELVVSLINHGRGLVTKGWPSPERFILLECLFVESAGNPSI